MSNTCVYQYYDKGGALLYVGITGRGRRRSHEHARDKEWWPLTTGCSIEHYDSRQEALDRESYLIAAYKPPYNTQGRDHSVSVESIRLARTESPTLVGAGVETHAHSVSILRLFSSGEYKAAIRTWAELPKGVKTHLKARPCFACHVRPMVGTGPMCQQCHNNYVGGLTRKVRREQTTVQV